MEILYKSGDVTWIQQFEVFNLPLTFKGNNVCDVANNELLKVSIFFNSIPPDNQIC